MYFYYYQQGRIPVNCPPGFTSRYTVELGDTFYTIAQKFGVNPLVLIRINRHIPVPYTLYPGDILCLPGIAPPLPPGFPL